MLEQFIIFTKGGLILYIYGNLMLQGDPIFQLIKNILLEVNLNIEYFKFLIF